MPELALASTRVREEPCGAQLRTGDTVWVAQGEDWHVGLAWEWIEVKPGIVMLADPNSIITNLQFVDSEQQAVTGLSKTVLINRIVHATPWQQSVCSLLQATVPLTLNQPAMALPLSDWDTAQRVPAVTALPDRDHDRLRADLRAPSLVPARPGDIRALDDPRRAPNGGSNSRISDREDLRQSRPAQDLRRAA